MPNIGEIINLELSIKLQEWPQFSLKNSSSSATIAFPFHASFVLLIPSQNALLQTHEWGQCHPFSSICIVWKNSERIRSVPGSRKQWID